MDVFALLLPLRPRLVLAILLNAMIVAALLMLCWYGYFGMLRAHRVMSVAVGVQESFLYGALPVGAALMALRMIAVIVGDVIVLVTPHKIAADDLPPANERYL
ncbi:Tripartite ATP-independent periplasmic transporter, DctQ component [compost metagenome]